MQQLWPSQLRIVPQARDGLRIEEGFHPISAPQQTAGPNCTKRPAAETNSKSAIGDFPLSLFACAFQLRSVTNPHHNIILIGFMGSGKTSIGRLVATNLGFQFVDTDAVVVERAGMQVPEIFERHGEAWFRDQETSTLESMAILNRSVISTGGGIVLREENRAILQSLGFVVWLTASEDVIFERVARNKRRPLLQTADPRKTVRELLAERLELYQSVSRFTLDTSALSHEKAAKAVIAEARRAFSWHSGE
jgi:shikimate kinase